MNYNALPIINLYDSVAEWSKVNKKNKKENETKHMSEKFYHIKTSKTKTSGKEKEILTKYFSHTILFNYYLYKDLNEKTRTNK